MIALAVRYAGDDETAAEPVRPTREPRAPDNGVGRDGEADSGVTRDRQPDGTPTAAELAARRLLQICVEVLNGHRPVAHLRAITVPAETRNVIDQLVRRTAWTCPVRSGTRRVRLLSAHTCEPRNGVAEVAAVLECGPLTWAVAARLERRADAWLCTLLQVI